ncbi:hypothetical protein LCGC14_2476560 [marine sediment metagenome]|uniref:Uncharacterized protein n=1 Tax=marine sediment metagenome TaxID=412755 RepID=A0A0F9B8R4_9ZZZZ
MNEQNVKPKFEVHKLEGKAIRPIATPKTDPKRKDKNGNPVLLGGFDYEDKEVDAGWMVYFPSGSSIRIWTREEMERQGFLRPAPLVDMDTGDTVAPEDGTSLKENSERKTSRTRSSKVAQV